MHSVSPVQVLVGVSSKVYTTKVSHLFRLTLSVWHILHLWRTPSQIGWPPNHADHSLAVEICGRNVRRFQRRPPHRHNPRTGYAKIGGLGSASNSKIIRFSNVYLLRYFFCCCTRLRRHRDTLFATLAIA